MTNQGSVFACREGVSFQPPLTPPMTAYWRSLL
jgi:hypothetical protein